MSWKNPGPVVATLAAVAVVAGSVMYFTRATDAGGPAVASAPAATPTTLAASVHSPGLVAGSAQKSAASDLGGSGRSAAVAVAATTVLSPAAQAAVQQLQRLAQLPAGDSAILLAQQLEAGITAENTPGYLSALFGATNPVIERTAIAALARAGDSGVMRSLARAYGGLAPEQRGRVLQVLENAENPAALPALVEVFAADSSEKRSALVMSALVGVAHIGTMESVQYLLSQVTPANADYALTALDRVSSAQGVEMIKAAAQGSKDASAIPAAFLPALKRLADSRTAS